MNLESKVKFIQDGMWKKVWNKTNHAKHLDLVLRINKTIERYHDSDKFLSNDAFRGIFKWIDDNESDLEVKLIDGMLDDIINNLNL